MYRWFSGKYDSVKQKQLSLEYDEDIVQDRDDMFRMYTASLRLEMLFYGTVVITDSQWYDGRYFARLSDRTEDFFYFKKLMMQYSTPLFVIRRDTNYFIRIFANAFEFSSLTGDVLNRNSIVPYVKEFGADKADVIKKSPSFREYFKLLRLSIDPQFKQEIDIFEEHIRHLDIIPPSLLSFWSVDKTKPSMVWRVFNGTLKDNPGIKVIAYLESKYLNHWCDDAPVAAKIELEKHKEEIKAQIYSVIPNRSAIKTSVDSSNEQIKNPLFDELFDYISFLFNTAFSLQHQCDLCDVADISEQIVINNSIDPIMKKLPLEFYYCISNLSWREFEYFLNYPKIKESRKSWLDAYNNKDRAFEKLDILIDTINNLVNKSLVHSYEAEYKLNVKSRKLLVAGGSSTKLIHDTESCYLIKTPTQKEITRFSFNVNEDAKDFHLGTISTTSNSIVIAANP